MNRAKKNVVIVGFTDSERNSISIPLLDEPYCYTQEVHYLKSLSNINKYQGYLLIIDNSDNKRLVDIDKKYRKSLNKYELIWLYNSNYNKYYKDKWSRIEKIDRYLFNDLGYCLGEEWNSYKELKEKDDETITFNKYKQNNMNILCNYLKKYKTRKTKDISKDLKLNERSIQRYMYDLNRIYHNIGYDYSNNEWYIIGS